MVSYVFSAPWGKHSSTYLIIFASLSIFFTVFLLLFSASIFSTIFKSEFLCIFADLQEVEWPVVLKDILAHLSEYQVQAHVLHRRETENM